MVAVVEVVEEEVVAIKICCHFQSLQNVSMQFATTQPRAETSILRHTASVFSRGPSLYLSQMAHVSYFKPLKGY